MTKKDWVDFKKVKENVRFEPVLNHYGVKLKSTNGAEILGHCPFHDDKKPSFQVNTQKRLFYCHGCGAKGNVLDFVSQKETVSIREAALLLSQWFDENSREEKRIVPETPDQKNRPLTFTLKLEQNHPYLKERRLDAEIINFFGLGYCNRGLMKNRIAIPIHDEQGKLVAYAGRWPADIPPDREEKYMLPRGFKKSHVLFNLHRVTGAKVLVIVEGYWSVFCLHQLAIPAVALMGRTLSKTQEALLKAGKVGHLILMLDGDDPGREAQAELLPHLARYFFTKTVDLPEGHQPDTTDEKLLLELLRRPWSS